MVFTGKLVFQSDPTDFTGHFVGIATLNADGTDYQKLTDYFEDGDLQGYRPNSPVWSADGEQIAFVADKNDAPSRLYVMNADGTGLTSIAESETGAFSSPSWSPNGDKIVYAFQDNDDHELYIFDLVTNEISQLTDNEYTDSSPAWSPDGEWIAFNADRDGDFELYIVQPDGSELLQMTDNQDSDSYPAWSPDGGQLAFVSDRESNNAIYRMSVTDKQATHITNNSSALITGITWSPDGDYIAYADLMPTEDVDPQIITHPATGIFIVRVSDGKSQPLPYSFVGWNASPSWVE
jgi:TolB protein